MKPPRSLGSIITVRVIAAGIVAMAVYAIVEYLITPNLGLKELFFHHLLHVLVIAIVACAVGLAALGKILIEPVERIHLYLYRIGKGELHPLALETKVAEIETIVLGINMMVHQLRNAPSADALRNARNHVSELRAATEPLRTNAPASSAELLELVQRLERDLLALSQSDGVRDTA